MESQKWATVTQVSPLEVRFPGDTVDTPISLKASGLTLALNDRVALDRRGLGWVAAYKMVAS